MATPVGIQRSKASVGGVIHGFILKIRGIRRCASDHIQIAAETRKETLRKFLDSIVTVKKESGDEETFFVPYERVKELALLLPHSEIICQSLLIYGFAALDAFLGSLLRQLYLDEPNLIYALEQKEITVADLMRAATLEDVKNNVIDRDVSALLRGSYREIFITLEKRHKTELRKFLAWPSFIEASQRRNLLTHCNGVVSEQYLEVCRNEGLTVDPTIENGATLSVDPIYLRKALDLLYEVGIRLGHTLWRVTAPSKALNSEKALTKELNELLKGEEWELAKIIGQFAVTIPKPKSDLQTKLSRINYAQALKWSGNHLEAMEVLDAVDWSASIRDLRLSVEVLRENFDVAAGLMKEIGRRGELIDQLDYQEWPVFRAFRKTKQFQEAYKSVYGVEFLYSEDTGSEVGAIPDANLPDVGDVKDCPRTFELDMSSNSKPPNDDRQ